MLPFCVRQLPLLLLLLAACESRRASSPPVALKQLEGTWLAASEENSGDTLVYRPNTHRFPPARGRTGFALGPFGRFEQFDLAPTDGLVGRPGTWTAAAGGRRLRVHLTDGQWPDYTLEILAFDRHKRVLKLRRLP